jgi:hypothetical protein
VAEVGRPSYLKSMEHYQEDISQAAPESVRVPFATPWTETLHLFGQVLFMRGKGH